MLVNYLTSANQIIQIGLLHDQRYVMHDYLFTEIRSQLNFDLFFFKHWKQAL